MREEFSDCCMARVDWTSYNVQDFPKNHDKTDHFTCTFCKNPCRVVNGEGRYYTEEELWDH